MCKDNRIKITVDLNPPEGQFLNATQIANLEANMRDNANGKFAGPVNDEKTLRFMKNGWLKIHLDVNNDGKCFRSTLPNGPHDVPLPADYVW